MKSKYVNEMRTLRERRLLYCYLRQIGLTRTETRVFYNWTTPHISWALKELSTKRGGCI